MKHSRSYRIASIAIAGSLIFAACGGDDDPVATEQVSEPTIAADDGAMDEEAIGLLRDQAVLTWTTHKKQMLKRIKSGSLSLVSLRAALSKNYPAIMAEIEANVLGKK